jgi:large subunit ribosomal protein L29
MKASDLHAKSATELQAELIELLKTQFKMRIQKATGQLTRIHLIQQVRRDIARVKTVLNEKAGT